MNKYLRCLAAVFFVSFSASAALAECPGIEFNDKGKIPKQDVDKSTLGEDCVVTVKASTKFTNACLTIDELIDGATSTVVGIGVVVEGDQGECSAFTSVDNSGTAKVRSRCKNANGKTKIRFEMNDCFETPIPDPS